MKVEIGFDLSANGQGNYFTLDDTTKGVLDSATYVLGGDVMVDVTNSTRRVSTKRGRSRTLDKFTAGNATVTLDNRDRAFDPTYAPSTTTRTNLVTNPSAEVDATGWTATSETSDNMEAKAVLAGATFWIDAAFASSSQTVTNLGTAGATLNATLGSTGSADSNDPQWLPYAGTPYVYLPGTTSNWLNVPDAAALDITGDLAVYCRAALDDWTPSAIMALVSKFKTSTPDRSWEFRVQTTGTIELITSADGAAAITHTSTTTPPLTDGTAYWLAATIDVDNGAAGHDVRFYYAADQATVPSSWTQIGSTVTTAGTTSLFSGGADVMVGSTLAGATRNAAGKFYRAIVSSGIGAAGVPGGSTVLDVDTSVVTGSSTTFTATTGQTVTVNRATGTGRKTVCVTQSCWAFGTDDMMEVPDTSNLLDLDASTSLSVIAVYRNWDAQSSNRAIVAKQTSAGGTTAGWTMYDQTGTLKPGMQAGDGTRVIQTAAASAFTAGTLVMQTGVVDRGNTLFKSYTNGTLDGSSSTNVAAFTDASNATVMRIGQYTDTASFGLGMELVAVAVFRSALTAGQITTISDYYSGRAAYATAACTRVTGGVYGTYGASATNTSGYSTLGVVYASAAVSAGTAYTGSLYMKGTTASARVVLDWYGASGYISRSAGTAANGNATAWTRYSATGTAPTGATSVQVRLDMAANSTTPVYVDSALVESGSTLGAYFDGTYSDGSIRYTSRAWTGTTDASTSTITAYVTGTGSPYYGSILPRKAIRISRDDQVMFTGLTADWNFGYDLGGDSTADVSCTDGFALLAGQTRTAGTATPQAAGARIAAVLTEAGWPLTQRSLDTGQATLGADVIADTDNVLTYLQQVGTSEPGAVFIGKTGNLVFKDRASLQSPTSAVTFGTGGTPFIDIGVEYGIENLVTKANVAYTGGTATVENTTASAAYGVLEQTYDTLLSSSTDATALGNWLISLYSAPQYRVSHLTVHLAGLTTAQVLAVLALELGDVATVTWTPNSTGSALTRLVTIDGIEHSADPGAHTVTFTMSQTSAAFVLDSATFGLLDTSALGF